MKKDAGAAETEASDKKQVLVFRLHGQRYAVDILNVAEVISYREPTDVFHTPPYVVGILNLRGVVIAIFDTASFFDLPKSHIFPTTRILVIRSTESGPEQEAGFIVDEVMGARRIIARNLYAPPATITGAPREYISGVLEEKEGPLIMMSFDRIFVSEKVASL